MKLNKDSSDNTSGDSINLTPENGSSTPIDEKIVVFPITIKDERQLFKLSKRIRDSKKSLAGSDDEDDKLETKGYINFAHSAYDNGIRNIALNNVGKKFVLRRISESEEIENVLKRCKSAPSLVEK